MKQQKTPEFLEKLRPFIEWFFGGPFLYSIIFVGIAVNIISPSWSGFLIWSIAIGIFAYSIKDAFKSK